MANTVITTDPIGTARANVESIRLSLEAAKADLIFAVKDSQPFLYDKNAGLYVGPDRHNADWVVSWDANTARAAATQMVMDGERSCNWNQCPCKRSQRGTFQARF